jgi:hypothetical protein
MLRANRLFATIGNDIGRSILGDGCGGERKRGTQECEKGDGSGEARQAVHGFDRITRELAQSE